MGQGRPADPLLGIHCGGLKRDEETMRKDVEFKTEDGVTLRGWLYLPDRASGRVPTIVMAHGFSAVKENYLDKYAEV
jgi:cephalosporin-C deacetylase-like acetyl esterase